MDDGTFKYSKSKHSNSKYGKSEYAKSKYGRSEHAKSENVKSEYAESEYGKSEYVKSKYAKSEYGKSEYARSEYGKSKNDETDDDTQKTENSQQTESEEIVLKDNELTIEGRNAVIEAFRAGKTIDRLYILDGCKDGPIATIKKEARKQDTQIRFVEKERLDHMSVTGKHQGVIAVAAAYAYSEIEDIFNLAKERNEKPFILILDNIEDPHNLGAIIRTANVAGVHGVIIPKNRAVGLTASVARTSAGAINYTPVVKVTNIAQTIEKLKERGMWFVCADMGGQPMTKVDMTGPIGLVIGNEGEGVSRLVKDKCDMTAAIPMKGEIESLNASVAAGVLIYEIVRQRGNK